MIRLESVHKSFFLNGVRTVVANNINAVFPDRRAVALMGRNGAGKSSLMNMIAGTMAPDHGRIRSDGAVSWPVGFSGSAHPELTGLQNTRFVARIYGVDTDELVEYVRDFADLGDHFFLPVRSYSSGMKSRLAFGISMGIKFDTYLIDEVTSVGDAAFKEKSSAVLKERLNDSGAVVVSHSMGFVKDICHHGAVLEDGNLVWFDDINDAVDRHLRNIEKRKKAQAALG